MGEPGGMLQSNDLRAVRAASAAEAERSSAPAADVGTAAVAPGADPVTPGSRSPATGIEPLAPGSGAVAPESAAPAPGTEPAAFAADRAELPVQLDFLHQSVEVLEVPDPFGPEFAVAGGEWRALPPAAEFWRAAAEALREGTSSAADQVSGVEASWDGADADAFAAALRRIGASGAALAEVADALAAELDAAAGALRELAGEMGLLVAEVAAQVYAALREPGPDLPAAREHLMRVRRPAAGLAESVREVLARLHRFCAAQRDVLPPVPAVTADGPRNPLWTELAAAGEPRTGAAPATTTPATTSPAQAGNAEQSGDAEQSDEGTSAATTGAVLGGGMVGGMMPLAGMAGLAGAGGGTGRRSQKRPRPKADPAELFGTPPPAADPVLGDTRKKRPE
ncbi:hypothetical protein [Saccharopolyspora sp. 6M]|uniref:hypothetical protein n=1 Tax=Saccharopolyspora sp. 6M TaxID=2877237 RepID=UPI001CD5EBA6|nr:hypothetical protein [Saccharopolyspora sp. 6M]MCA1225897.1 hypothetical protein [Saccharopolyspora sp. 6M]